MMYWWHKQYGDVRGPPGFSPWSYKLDINSTKDSLLNTKTHLRDLHIETPADGHIKASREVVGREEEKRQEMQMQSGTCHTVPVDAIAVKGQGATPHLEEQRWSSSNQAWVTSTHWDWVWGQRQRSEARVAVFNKSQSPDIESLKHRNTPSYPPVACPELNPHSLEGSQNVEAILQAKLSVLTVAKPTGKNRAKDAWTNFLRQVIHIQSWGLVASSCKKVKLGTHRPGVHWLP